MEPVLAQAVATLITAISTSILMAAAYYWGPTQRANRRKNKEDNTDDE